MSTPVLKLLAERIQKNQHALWDWYSKTSLKAPPPFYCSIDLRDSGYKIVPVDSNLYPAGFNNICPEDLRVCPSIFRTQLEAILTWRGKPAAQKVLILPEAHTKNGYYIENIYYLNQIVQNAGYETRIGWYGPLPGAQGSFVLRSFTGKELTAYPLEIRAGIAGAGGFIPDIILLNNDFSSGYPSNLDPVLQPILPSHTLGWHSRKKSEHFTHYNQLAGQFASILDIDPWLIQIDTESVEPVNFNEGQGTEEVAQMVDRMLARTKEAYRTHEVKREPFVFVKNNAGTYGMGVMVAHSAAELRQMNRRTKNKMSVGKGHQPIQSIVVQEGVPTATVVDRLAAEPVIYLFGAQLIGGFLRANTEKGDEENLNSEGMAFKKLCMSDLRDLSVGEQARDQDSKPEPIRELVYGAVARLSALATGMELAKHARENN